MANFSVILQQQRGAKSEKPVQRSFEVNPDQLDRGICDVVKLWAKGAEKGACLTISLRRDL